MIKINKEQLKQLILDGKSIEDYDYSHITDMFTNCTSLTTIPGLDTSNVTDMRYMLDGCSSLEHIFYHSDIDYTLTDSEQLKINYPEYFI